MGERRQHNVNITFTSLNYTLVTSVDSVGDSGLGEFQSRWPNRFEDRVHNQLSFEYDYYTSSGNLFYTGTAGSFPYWGFTFAFENVHIGVIGNLLPLVAPYIYLRF